MLSYQHIYHAGNFADVHKHVALMLLLEKLNDRPAPYAFFDTHAGRGIYDLASHEANKTGEYRHGVTLIKTADPFKSALGRYQKLLAKVRQKYGAQAYPGSPAIARELLRQGDRLILSELHPGEIKHLREAFKDDRAEIHRQDAMKGMISMIPPSVRRGLVLIDPSYEIKTEYTDMPMSLRRALTRWPNGIFALWYPILDDARHGDMLTALRNLPYDKTVSEFLAPKSIDGHRLLGSGLVVFNAPSGFAEKLHEATTDMRTALFEGAGDHQLS